MAQAIVRRQSGFLQYGALAMKPLALSEITQEIVVHESTVCRVINDKYLAAPAGLIELKQFFSRAMPVSGGGACSPMLRSRSAGHGACPTQVWSLSENV